MSESYHSRRQLCHAWLFLVIATGFWLVPFFQAGWSGRAYAMFKLPRALTFQYNAAGLFTRRSTQWWDHHIELQLPDGQRMELDERSVFPMGAFGYRTRMDRILNESQRGAAKESVLSRMANFVAQELSKDPALTDNLNTERGQIIGFRIIRSVWKVGSSELAEPAGHWNPPPVDQLDYSQRRTLGSWRLIDGKAVAVAQRGEQKAEPATERSPGSVIRRRIILPGADSPPVNSHETETEVEP